MAVCEVPAITSAPPPSGSRYAEPRKRLVSFGTNGRAREVHRRASRLVVDDFGDAVAVQRRCSSCMRWGMHAGTHCDACQSFFGQRRRALDPEGERRKARERYRRLMDNDPVARERVSERMRANREASMVRDPERERMLRRERQRRRRERVLRDPALYRVEMERGRMNAVLQRMRKGLPAGTGKGRRVDGTGARFARRSVASAPLAAAVTKEALRLDEDFAVGERIIAKRAGLSEKVLYNWRTGRSPRAIWDSADRVLVALDVMWWEVFDSGAIPGLFSGERGRDVVAWTKAALDAAELWGDA
jgi:hypothetical protein